MEEIYGYGVESVKEQAYHCDAFSKDAGKELCAINKIENTAMLHSVIDNLLLEDSPFSIDNE